MEDIRTKSRLGRRRQNQRRPQGQLIRRIPEYEFFEPFKHTQRTYLSHGKNMTAKHMLEEHLFGEPGGRLKKLEKIQKHIWNTAKPFYSKLQKSMKEHAKKLAERIKKLIKIECEPFQRKIKQTEPAI